LEAEAQIWQKNKYSSTKPFHQGFTGSLMSNSGTSTSARRLVLLEIKGVDVVSKNWRMPTTSPSAIVPKYAHLPGNWELT